MWSMYSNGHDACCIEKLLGKTRRDLLPDNLREKSVFRYFPHASVFSVPETAMRSGSFDAESWPVFVENEFWRVITASRMELRQLFPAFKDMLNAGKCTLFGFQLASVLGCGTHAVAYLTADGFVLKVVPASGVSGLLHEFGLLRRIQHENIVQAYDFFSSRGGAAILMERIHSHAAALSHYQAGLTAIHRHGCLHGDIRRSNIGTGRNGNGKLFDLGNSSGLTAHRAKAEFKCLSLLFADTADQRNEPSRKTDNHESKMKCASI